jgi:hypothetical protein
MTTDTKEITAAIATGSVVPGANSLHQMRPPRPLAVGSAERPLSIAELGLPPGCTLGDQIE